MIHQRAKFITIERPLLPPPPIESFPEWCYTNTLIFYDSQHKEVWRQEIPEAELHWMKINQRDGDEFDHYFWPFELFKDGNFGWQLRFSLSHERADFWLNKMLEYVKEYHAKHFLVAEIHNQPSKNP